MKTKVPKGLYLIPVIYIGIITIFIYLQFSGEDTFTSRVSHLTAMGKISKNPLGGDDDISDLQILGTGLLFPLDSKNPIRIYATDGLVHKAVPFKYRNSGGKLEIEMTSGLTLSLTPDQENSESVIMGIGFNDYTSIKSVSIPFTVARDFQIDSTGGLPVFSVNDKRDGDVTMLTLPMGASLDEAGGRIIIPCSSGETGKILLERTAEIRDPLSFWFSKKADLLTEEEYSLFLEDYLSRAMAGFHNDRFDPARGVWEIPEEDPRFSEEIASILLSTAMTKNEFRSQMSRIGSAVEKTDRLLSFQTVPFLGDIVKVTQVELRKTNTKIQTLNQMIAQNNPEIFVNHDLYNLMYLRQNTGKTEELSIMAALGDRTALSTPAVSGLLKYYIDRIEHGENNPELTEQLDNIITLSLLPRIMVLQDGFFLESENNKSDLLLSIRTGSYLIKSGAILNRAIFSTLGQELVYSAMQKADMSGVLPGILHLDDGKILTQGGVTPEEIYPLIFSNPYYPKELSASPEGEPGSWIFTAASEVGIKREGNAVKYSFKYKPGEIHYILIQGVKPFKRMVLLGLNWNPDPVFYRYYSGWYYDEKTQSLYIKIRNKVENEEITLFY